ncbi:MULTISPECIES: hypothetical protein [Acinetobacter calcoaceticus/baumannii complex]|uniref:Uncharacterized protein n=1 Tax=Acinetobacter nosocomialis TaxID=106654 RepID=A0AB37CSB2_ACINO|nr:MULTISPECIES: hypothetical protein [Acinetobacter calcoaceticus/baumannii complex]MCJ9113939.1 hypothetical protein [Acinetobacter baumannii]MCJ9227687.1 hypothetical protein [Acinetobacter baumannii]MCJ9462747.1 hypothetical protein [Acinetobacter baumannii]MDP7803298.1 hypothetical protein [Acinetobacter baumannii]MDP7886454.1 hypothetical protein [Acinetobacter baumannii]
MKYFRNQKTGEVFSFDDDLIEMNAEEVDRHINPQKYLSDKEKEQLRLAEFKPLTRRQFKLALLQYQLLEKVEQAIADIEDPALKTRVQIEYNESEKFERANDSVKYMLTLLDISNDEIDEMWRYAMSL